MTVWSPADHNHDGTLSLVLSSRYMDLLTNQTVAGNKTFSGTVTTNATLIANAGVWAGGASTGAGAILEVIPPSGAPAMAVKANGNDLARYFNASGTQVALIDSVGAINGAAGHFGVYASAPSAYMTVVSAADFPAAILRASSGQTTNIEEWQNNGGTKLTRVMYDGRLQVRSSGDGTDMSASVDAGAYIAPRINSGVGLAVFGLASQSGDLQGWFNSTPTTVARITSGGNVQGTGAYTTLSDATVKENISPLQLDPVQVVSALNPVHFDYIDGDSNQVGFIAQDLQAVLPAAVTPWGDSGLLAYQSEVVLAYVVGALQPLLQDYLARTSAAAT